MVLYFTISEAASDISIRKGSIVLNCKKDGFGRCHNFHTQWNSIDVLTSKMGTPYFEYMLWSLYFTETQSQIFTIGNETQELKTVHIVQYTLYSSGQPIRINYAGSQGRVQHVQLQSILTEYSTFCQICTQHDVGKHRPGGQYSWESRAGWQSPETSGSPSRNHHASGTRLRPFRSSWNYQCLQITTARNIL